MIPCYPLSRPAAFLLIGQFIKPGHTRRQNRNLHQNIDGLVLTDKSFFWNNPPQNSNVPPQEPDPHQPFWTGLIKHMVKADQTSMGHLLRTAEILGIAALLMFFL